MPEYAQVQTYATCNPRSYTTIVQAYREVLARLHCSDQVVLQWLDQLRWSTNDDEASDIYACPFDLVLSPTQTIACAGVGVSLYLQSAALSTEEQPAWVGFDLLFDIDSLLEPSTSSYQSGVGGVLWQIMKALGVPFHELGVYFTDEWQDNRAWRTLVEGVGYPWVFDLAIFPRKLASHFESVPTNFQGTVTEQGFGFAQQHRWHKLPWLEAQDK